MGSHFQMQSKYLKTSSVEKTLFKDLWMTKMISLEEACSEVRKIKIKIKNKKKINLDLEASEDLGIWDLEDFKRINNLEILEVLNSNPPILVLDLGQGHHLLLRLQLLLKMGIK